jgi:hypothetical protein
MPTEEKSEKAPKISELSDRQKGIRIKELLAEMEGADAGAKRNIRSKLRALGHVGGLGKRAKKEKPAKAEKSAAKPKGKRAAKAEPAAAA